MIFMSDISKKILSVKMTDINELPRSGCHYTQIGQVPVRGGGTEKRLFPHPSVSRRPARTTRAFIGMWRFSVVA
jgi:hypothetical protein